jgi:hypothetical protein
MNQSALLLVILCLRIETIWSFLSAPSASFGLPRLMSDRPSDEEGPPIPESSLAGLEKIKAELVTCCKKEEKPSLLEVQNLVSELESVADQIGAGQASSISGLMNGEW